MLTDNYLIKSARKRNKTLVFPEAGFSERIIEAAKFIHRKKMAKVVLLGDESALVLRYKKQIKGMTIINPKTSSLYDELVDLFLERRKDKGLTREEAEKLALDPIYFGTLLVEGGFADGMVAGAETSSAKVIRPALQIIKAKEKGCVSSFILFYGKNKMLGKDGVIFASDVGVNIDPSKEDLVQIAKNTAQSFEKFVKTNARVAMLSYSTKDSANGDSAEKVKNATAILKKDKSFVVEGEIQLDSALAPEVCKRKYLNSAVKGNANVLIFPNLDAGNICYKAIQYFGNVSAIGPILQNLNKPVNDLSRGCAVKDIVLVAAITAMQA